MIDAGNGVLVNSKVKVNGKEKSICHITRAGRMNWYADSNDYPEAEVKKLTNIAEYSKICTEKYVDAMLKTDTGYFKLIEDVCHVVVPRQKVLDLVKEMQDKTQDEQKQIMKQFYMANM